MLSKLKWVSFGDEIVTKPDRADVELAMGDVDLVVEIQLRSVKFSVRQIYMACGWNDKAKDLDAARQNVIPIYLSIRSKNGWNKSRRFLIKHTKNNGSGRG